MPRWPHLSDLQRFAQYVEPVGDCLVWRGGKQVSRRGGLKFYGAFWTRTRMARAHRWIYEYLIGPVPRELVLDHLCRNTLCVNVLHVEPVPQRTNVLRGKGRSFTHCPNGHAFTEANTTYRATKGYAFRRCLVCERESSRKYRARRVA